MKRPRGFNKMPEKPYKLSREVRRSRGRGLFWENWNVYKSFLLVGPIAGVLIFSGLTFGGQIFGGRFESIVGLGITIAIAAAGILGVPAFLFIRAKVTGKG